MTQTTNKKMVVAQCNPYDAKSHYNGQRVLGYDMTTPVKWVMDDDYGYGLSEEEALTKLEAYASADGYEYFDEESLAEYVKMVKEDFEVEDVDTSWYEGRGYYDMENMYCAYICGNHYYRHDTMFYSIEDFVAEEKPKQLVVRKISTGYIYEYVDSIEEGESLIREMEADDKECGDYEENYYEVAEIDAE